MNTAIPNLTIERNEDGSFSLGQDDCSGTIARLTLHETQVRHISLMAGLLPAAAAVYMPPAWVLARRLRALLDRINELDERLRIVANAGHEDLEHELSYSFASWEIASEFCADLAPPRGTQGREASLDVTRRHGNVTAPAVTPVTRGHGAAREGGPQLDLVGAEAGTADQQRAAR